jgi:hypothetical protein
MKFSEFRSPRTRKGLYLPSKHFLATSRVAGFHWTQNNETVKKVSNCFKLPYGHKLYQMFVKYSKLPSNIPTFSVLRPSKISPKLGFLKIYHLATLATSTEVIAVQLQWMVRPKLSQSYDR